MDVWARKDRPRFLRPECAVALCLLFITLSGCTSFSRWVRQGFKVGPNYGRPPAEVNSSWIDANDKRVGTETEDISQWWTVFGDPALNSLVTDAYRQNLTLREAGFRVLEARAQRAIAVGNLFPQTQQLNGDFQRIGISRARANTSFIPTRFSDQWDLGFNMNWELDFWGRFRRAVEAADAELDASVEGYDDVLVTLLGDTAATYVDFRTAQQKLRFVYANVELQRETVKLAQARFDAGQTSELDLDQAQSTLYQTEALIPQFQIQVRFATNRLSVLMGRPPIDLEQCLRQGEIPIAPTRVVIGIPADLLRRRPDVRQAERVAAAQCARIGIADADMYPHFGIGGNIGWSAEKLNNLLTSDAMAGNIAPQFQWNILNYGRLLNNVRLQEARFQEFVAHYQNVVLNANAEVEDGLVQFLRAQEQANSLRESVIAAEKAVRVSLAQYKGGIVDFNRVALLQQNLVQQQDLYAQARGEIANGLIRVYRALGGGWEIRCQPGDTTAAKPSPPAGTPTPARDNLEQVPFTVPALEPERLPTPDVNSPSDLPSLDGSFK